MTPARGKRGGRLSFQVLQEFVTVTQKLKPGEP